MKHDIFAVRGPLFLPNFNKKSTLLCSLFTKRTLITSRRIFTFLYMYIRQLTQHV